MLTNHKTQNLFKPLRLAQVIVANFENLKTNKMNKLILTVTAMIFSFTLFAQPMHEAKDGMKAAHRLEYLTIVLDLTNNQVNSIKTLQEANKQKIDQIKSKYKPTLEEMKSKIKPLRENPSPENKEKVKQIRASYKDQLAPMKTEIKATKEAFKSQLKGYLTPSQLTKFEKLEALKAKQKAERKADGKKHGKPMRGIDRF